jgi:thioredoxin
MVDKKLSHYLPFLVKVLLVILLTIMACTPEKTQNPDSIIKSINSVEEFNQITDTAKDQLLVFDLYADWCRPCRVLSPLLEEIALENKDKATFYKINVDENRELAAALRTRGIPYVVFLKNKTVVYSLVGVQPKASYVRAINLRYKSDMKTDIQPDGEIIKGIREIEFKTGINPHDIYVYRGETVKLIFPKQDYPYSVHIPAFDINQKAFLNKKLIITFKARKTGVFPIFCNGDCPDGDGSLKGKIIVMVYRADQDVLFKHLSAAEAKKIIEEEKILILDVRTPREYYSGYLAEAKLIPLNQLSERISELKAYQNQNILIYCRSGNRSIVASEILINKGFKKIFNLENGILEWQEKGYPIVK